MLWVKNVVLVQRRRSCKSDDAPIRGTRDASPADGKPLIAAAAVLPLDIKVEQERLKPTLDSRRAASSHTRWRRPPRGRASAFNRDGAAGADKVGHTPL